MPPITFEIDGREVQAPEGEMLVDAAKRGDVEIPYFCYEPKLGPPVGACRMCLVEIEGMPKLQTACSTPVKDGMVVNTTSAEVKGAQNAVVEFLLVNHPLDCPVCDKGGECPLQDISYGWGPGKSRFIEPKRHFKKPIELSPLIAIDRERCILCYRCVRFSQEVAEDYQLVFLERGDHTFVGTHDGRPYVGPFSGNIIELCPVGALTSRAYRFRARPWDIEGSGSLCLLCPSQCNVEFTVRDDAKILRVLARDNAEVDDGWLCDKGRFGYQAIHTPERLTVPLVRDGGALRRVSWERALSEAAAALERAGASAAGIAGGEATNEEGFLLQHLIRKGCGSGWLGSTATPALDPALARVLARPDLSARTTDIDTAGAVLVVETELVDEAPILDLRVRKAARRNGVKVVTVTSRPSSLDPNASATVRIAPGALEAGLAALADPTEDLAGRAGADNGDLRAAAEVLRGAESVVILWGSRALEQDRSAQTVSRLIALARGLGATMIEVPAGSNGRGLREVGCAPGLGPGLAEAGAPEGATDQPAALVAVQADPPRGAANVIAFASFLTEELEEEALVVLPAESYAEKEGTVTHPDGRLQRVREAIGRPGEVQAGWRVLLELCERLGAGLEAPGLPQVTAEMASAVGIYDGLTLEEIGGTGVRWQERDAAAKLPEADLPEGELENPPELPAGTLLGTPHSLWSGPVTEHSPALRFLAPKPRVELAPADAEGLGVAPGDEVVVSSNGTSVRAVAALRSGVRPGSVFLVGANGLPRSVEVRKA
jgi:NADH-quinone oxidoreductase subunit G